MSQARPLPPREDGTNLYLMLLRLARRLIAMILVVALVIAGHGLMAAQMDAAGSMTVANGMAPSGECNGCAQGDSGMSSAQCFASCRTGAVAVLPVMPLLGAAVIERTAPLSTRSVAGRSQAPDPHPPKSAVLS